MTKLLVLSDSHGARDAIKRILNKEQNNVDAVIFLGDGLRDLEQALAFSPICGCTPWPATAITVRWSLWMALRPLIRRWFSIRTVTCTV